MNDPEPAAAAPDAAGQMSEPPSSLPAGAWVWLLLTVSFALEVLLLAAYAVIGTGLVDGVAGWLIGLLFVVLVATVWGTFLAPKRAVDLPATARVALELSLFGIAGLGLALVGHVLWGLALVVAEAAVLTLQRTTEEPAEVVRAD